MGEETLQEAQEAVSYEEKTLQEIGESEEAVEVVLEASETEEAPKDEAEAEEEVAEAAEASEPLAEEEEKRQADLKEKQEAYRERQRIKREKAAAQPATEAVMAAQPEQAKSGDSQGESDVDVVNAVKELKEWRENQQRQQQYAANLKAAKLELSSYEEEYRQAFPDYDEKLEKALSFKKLEYVSAGMTEAQADDRLEHEKIMLADSAAARGEDPVEAISKEAERIAKFAEEWAKQAGYVPGSQKKQTNRQRRGCL